MVGIRKVVKVARTTSQIPAKEDAAIEVVEILLDKEDVRPGA